MYWKVTTKKSTQRQDPKDRTMKTLLKFSLAIVIIPIVIARIAHADTFVETISNVSAKDAVALYDGSIYASNYDTGIVYKIDEDGSSSIVVAANNGGAAGIRFDDSGNLYVAMYNLNSVIRVDSQGSQSTFASNILTPIALDWDNNQNLYVSSFQGTNTVTMIDPNGTATQLGVVSQLTQISSLALDGSGDIYITSYNSGDVYRMTPSGIVSLFISTGVSGLNFIQFDENENVFYAISGDNAILKIDPNDSTETIIQSSPPGAVDGPVADASIEQSIGLAVSADGKQVYFSSRNSVRRLVFADPSVDQVRPYFTNDASVSVEEAQSLNFMFEFADPNNDPLTLTLSGPPSWASFDGVDTLTGSPSSNDAGMTFNIAASVSDGIASVQSSLDIMVTAIAAPPPPPPPPTPAPAPAPQPDSGGSSGGSSNIVFLLFIFLFVGLRRLAIRRQ
jgi:sugar lactone lactonase YvrE